MCALYKVHVGTLQRFLARFPKPITEEYKESYKLPKKRLTSTKKSRLITQNYVKTLVNSLPWNASNLKINESRNKLKKHYFRYNIKLFE